MTLKKSSLLLLFAVPIAAYATAKNAHGEIAAVSTFLFCAIALLLLTSQIANFLSEKIGIPSVAGELILGVAVGSLAWFQLPGHEFIMKIINDKTLKFLSELGLVILLFEVGLETHWSELKRSGITAVIVGFSGVFIPFIVGALAAKYWLLPDHPLTTYLFIGASLSATSIAVIGRVFKELNFISHLEARIILGAAIIDDILCVIILSVLTQINETGSFSINNIIWLSLKAIIFIALCLTIGRYLVAKLVPRIFQKNASNSRALAILVISAFWGAAVAHAIGLEAIIGAFAAGMMFEDRLFKACQTQKNNPGLLSSTDLLGPLNHVFVPIFFISTGLQANLHSFFSHYSNILIMVAFLVIALLTKMVTGLLVKPPAHKWIVGLGMSPRGEVGLIFVAIGQQSGLISSSLFTTMVIVMILSTIIPPLLIEKPIRKHIAFLKKQESTTR